MAQVYQCNIPPLDDVANQVSANALRFAKAPGVVQGQNIDPGHLVAAAIEVNALQVHHHCNAVNVTTEDVGLAIARSAAVQSEFVARKYPQVAAPVGFNDALNAAVAAIRNDIDGIRNDVAGIRNDVAGIQNDVAGIRNDIAENHASMGARLDNQAIKHHNLFALKSAPNAYPLKPLKKVVAGVGPGLFDPNSRMNRNVRITQADVVAVGDPIDVHHFPVTLEQLQSLSQEDIVRLAKLYNEDFGIIQGDDIQNQIFKFQQFIS